MNQEPVSRYSHRQIIGYLPIMLRSVKCHLSSMDNNERIKNGECEYDEGGYFIVREGKSSYRTSKRYLQYDTCI